MHILKAFILFGIFLGTMGCVSTVPRSGGDYFCKPPLDEDKNYYYVVMQIPKKGKTTNGDQASTTTSSGKKVLVNNSQVDIKVGSITLHPGKSVELTADKKYIRVAKSEEFKKQILKKKLYINKYSDSIWVIERTRRE
jgi:hypothetical protein